MHSNIRFEVDADGVALLTLDVPGRPMNVFTPGFTADLRAAVAQIVQRADVRGAVITSGKASGFMAGADLKDLVGFHATGGSAADAAEAIAPGGRVLRELERCGKPVAVAINGVALGGGFELALACHHRVLLDEPRAVVGLPEVTVGLLPVGGGTQRLPRLIGIARALPLLLSGQHVAPAEALALGMVDALAPADQLVPVARRWVLDHPEAGQQPWDVKGFKVPGGAGALAPHAGASFGATLAQVRRDTHDNLPAPLAILSAVYEGTQLPMDAGLAVEAQCFGPLLAGPVARNLMRTLFVNRGAALRRKGDLSAVNTAYVERLRQLYRSEGAALLSEGVSPALIANAARQAGLGESPLTAEATATQTAASQPDARAVGERLLALLALEAVRCLEEGVLKQPVEADLGAVLALGYPDWTGGTLSYIETVGLAAFVARCDALAARHGERFKPTAALRERAQSNTSFYPTEQAA
ncbi:enoyl-CoA hydratase-related protein [Variovorax sp. EBFNA2]|uniref:enoyl-CoA hydratase-related protein n=1 Tax=Variovorax sp. EBFNA2 TaxID=3342097 RepID=UPI0029BFCB71|nr:enoyl-CoA hydratase-related protein [Variovorax boronicumulans]WPG37042.1 enoyl-CoA hydratase-related protein [Variovorax boronicumulans]